tara:strand:- start:3514 stop:3666 length:153 start_codon:yes stop_codon:yes gene_type:complete
MTRQTNISEAKLRMKHEQLMELLEEAFSDRANTSGAGYLNQVARLMGVIE